MLDLSQFKILVVDDEQDSLTFISTVLEDAGATVLEASNGHDALEIARREKPDLMTLDLEMPGMDGGQVFSAMRGEPELRGIPVCIISGHPELRGLIYQRSVPPPDGYLDKPVDQKRLLLNVRKILAHSQRHGEGRQTNR
jgi:CheY-like chemotaxis protein